MPLVSSKNLFEKALKKGYAYGAFNVNNMEIIQGIVDAAAEERAPLFLQFSAGGRKYARPEYLIKLVEAALTTSDIPVVLHLDHGEDFETCKACVDQGFTSVMIDGSKMPFEQNVALTRKVVDYAHERGVVVEAELGRLAGIEDNISVEAKDAIFTVPEQAKEFVERTACDSLAVAIGTSHGAYKFKGEAKLDFERLGKIEKLLPNYPLVLHGASSVLKEFVDKCNKYGGHLTNSRGVPEEMIARAVKTNVCKVNIDTDIRLAITASIREILVTQPEVFDPREYLGPAREAIKNMVRHKMRLLGCAGKA